MKKEFLIKKVDKLYTDYDWRQVETILHNILLAWDLDGFENEDGRTSKRRYLTIAITNANEDDADLMTWYSRMVSKLERRCRETLSLKKKHSAMVSRRSIIAKIKHGIINKYKLTPNNFWIKQALEDVYNLYPGESRDAKEASYIVDEMIHLFIK